MYSLSISFLLLSSFRSFVAAPSPVPDIPLIPGFSITSQIGKGTFGNIYSAKRYGERIIIKEILLKHCDGICLRIENQDEYPYTCEVAALRHLGLLESEPIVTESRVFIPMYPTNGISIDRFIYIFSENYSAPENRVALYDALVKSLERLHRQGVAHGDAHVGNVLLRWATDKSDTVDVTWIDMGRAKIDGEMADVNEKCRITDSTIEFEEDFTKLKRSFVALMKMVMDGSWDSSNDSTLYSLDADSS